MPLAEHGLEWVHPEAAYAHPLPDGDAKFLYRDLDRTAASVGGRVGRVRQAVPGPLRRRAGDDADRLPAARRPGEAAQRRRPAQAARLRADAARQRRRARQAPVRRSRLARLALRRRAARRHAAEPARLGDRRVLPEPARARGRLAVPEGRRAAAHRCARRLLRVARRRDPDQRAGDQGRHQRRPRQRRLRRQGVRRADRHRRRDAAASGADGRPAALVRLAAAPLPDTARRR